MWPSVSPVLFFLTWKVYLTHGIVMFQAFRGLPMPTILTPSSLPKLLCRLLLFCSSPVLLNLLALWIFNLSQNHSVIPASFDLIHVPYHVLLLPLYTYHSYLERTHYTFYCICITYLKIWMEIYLSSKPGPLYHQFFFSFNCCICMFWAPWNSFCAMLTCTCWYETW